MDDPEAYLRCLRRRYRRFFTIDQIVWVFYAVTALLPAWGLLTYTQHKLFHTVAFFLIVSVAYLGYSSNSMLKRNNPKGKTVGFAVTALFFVSRIGLLWYGILMAKRSLSLEWSEINCFDDLGILITWVVFVVGVYRFFYHIAAHFYVKLFIENVERNVCTKPGDSASVPSPSPLSPDR